MGANAYRGRFAPSPTGPLHAGSLVAALASWLDARAQGGTWLVRMEDTDLPRCVPGAANFILKQLETCGLVSDEPVWLQSQRSAAYASALVSLQAAGLAYPCACTRKDIELALNKQGHTKPRHGELRYPGTCRSGLVAQTGRAWRLHVDLAQREANKYEQKASLPLDKKGVSAPFFDHSFCHWCDRALGAQLQNASATVGDFVLQRADALWAYQLAVVVDDAAQGMTHVVRGSDLADNTPRQLLLQRALGLPHPTYLHAPLVWGANGEKLSKQNGAAALDLNAPLVALNAAAANLGLAPCDPQCVSRQSATEACDAALKGWVPQWAARWVMPHS